MKTQYILISTLIIVSMLFYYVTQINLTKTQITETIFDYVINFEQEIIYISRNFNKSFVLKFLEDFKKYLSLYNVKMTYVCITPEKYYNAFVEECLDTHENCCYIVRKPEYIDKLGQCQLSFLFKDHDIICICYNISKESEFYINLICI